MKTQHHSFMKPITTTLLVLACAGISSAQPKGVPPIPPLTPEWQAKVTASAPKDPRVAPTAPRRVLVCSLATGYCHEVIPHVKAVIDTLAKTGAFTVVHSDDIAMFEPAKLATFDAVVLNNTCTERGHRNWFIDVLASDKSLTEEQRMAKAAELEKGLIAYVESGKGLMAVHGGIVFLNNSMDFSQMLGGSFISHPVQQQITLKLVEPGHPLLKAFGGKPFTHFDEPYLFGKAYGNMDFRPLLEMDVDKLQDKARKVMQGERRFVSWIRRQGNGRVFYVSPSHRPESYERAELLQFYLDGMQYVLGDLKCDDDPIVK